MSARADTWVGPYIDREHGSQRLHQADGHHRHQRHARELREPGAPADSLRARRGHRPRRCGVEAEHLPDVRGRLRDERARDGRRRRDHPQRAGRGGRDARGEEARGQCQGSHQPRRSLREGAGLDPGYVSPRPLDAPDEANGDARQRRIQRGRLGRGHRGVERAARRARRRDESAVAGVPREAAWRPPKS